MVLLTDGQPDNKEDTLGAVKRITLDDGGAITLATLGVGQEDI